MQSSRDVYTVPDLDQWPAITVGLQPPPRLAVIGDPVEHSLSPPMQNAALQSARIDAQYVRVHVKPDELPQAIQRFKELGFLGVNVTIPHKTAVVPFVDELEPMAKRIGAVNTLLFEDRRVFGFNSDAPGLRQALRDEFSVDLGDLRILLLGAGGGAGRAAAIQCASDHCERLVLVNRTPEKAEALARELAPEFQDSKLSGPVDRIAAVPWEENALAEELNYIDLIINATNLGMKRTDPEVLSAPLIQPHHLVYDMVYRPPKTRLLQAAEEQGARGVNGLSMLLWQGIESFEYWFARRPSVPSMRKALREAAAAFT